MSTDYFQPDLASNAASRASASPTFTPDGSRLAWAEKDGVHFANTSDLRSRSAVTDRPLVAGDKRAGVPAGRPSARSSPRYQSKRQRSAARSCRSRSPMRRSTGSVTGPYFAGSPGWRSDSSAVGRFRRFCRPYQLNARDGLHRARRGWWASPLAARVFSGRLPRRQPTSPICVNGDKHQSVGCRADDGWTP
jgi:hypothetical protein